MRSSQDTSPDSHQSLIDTRVPGINGRELFNRMRDVEDIRAHVVFVTGDALDPGRQAFIRETGLPCLLKSFEVVDLLAVMEGDCERWRALRGNMARRVQRPHVVPTDSPSLVPPSL